MDFFQVLLGPIYKKISASLLINDTYFIYFENVLYF